MSDEDFGDFEQNEFDFTEIVKVQTPRFVNPTADAKIEEILIEKHSFISLIVKSSFPLLADILDEEIPGFIRIKENLISLNDQFAASELLSRFQTETIYTEESFRWRKSMIRAAFLESISVLSS